MRHRIIALVASLALVAGGACASRPSAYVQDASLVGAALGAGAGAIIGHQFGDGGRDTGALIGAATGAAMGMNYGQNEEMRASRQSQGYGYGQPAAGGGDDFRNPYRSPDPRFCRGAWSWDPMSGYWTCR
ncbi:MAG: glycine zipper 2TM domain-containing protein [Nitrospinae bacterium]|nr:glycine zipper 2TM domain-containing protein [Nitrospinota bacterium]